MYMTFADINIHGNELSGQVTSLLDNQYKIIFAWKSHVGVVENNDSSLAAPYNHGTT